MFTSSDEQLIKKATNGNKKAWFSLLSRYEKAVYNYALRMTGNPHDAKDLLQDIFIAVVKSLQNYSGKGAFKSWLFKIAHFKTMDFFRRRTNDISLDSPSIHKQNDNAEKPLALQTQLQTNTDYDLDKVSPETHLSQHQSEQQIMHLLQQLPFNQRLVVELKFFSQFTFEEIAQQLDVSANTAKSRLYAAIASLKQEATQLKMEEGHG